MEIEKIRRGLECLTQMTSCVGCPYWDCGGRTREDCLSHIGKDTLALLKDLDEERLNLIGAVAKLTAEKYKDDRKCFISTEGRSVK